jgi:hypothetical protein
MTTGTIGKDLAQAIRFATTNQKKDATVTLLAQDTSFFVASRDASQTIIVSHYASVDSDLAVTVPSAPLKAIANMAGKYRLDLKQADSCLLYEEAMPNNMTHQGKLFLTDVCQPITYEECIALRDQTYENIPTDQLPASMASIAKKLGDDWLLDRCDDWYRLQSANFTVYVKTVSRAAQLAQALPDEQPVITIEFSGLPQVLPIAKGFEASLENGRLATESLICGKVTIRHESDPYTISVTSNGTRTKGLPTLNAAIKAQPKNEPVTIRIYEKTQTYPQRDTHARTHTSYTLYVNDTRTKAGVGIVWSYPLSFDQDLSRPALPAPTFDSWANAPQPNYDKFYRVGKYSTHFFAHLQDALYYAHTLSYNDNIVQGHFLAMEAGEVQKQRSQKPLREMNAKARKTQQHNKRHKSRAIIALPDSTGKLTIDHSQQEPISNYPDGKPFHKDTRITFRAVSCKHSGSKGWQCIFITSAKGIVSSSAFYGDDNIQQAIAWADKAIADYDNRDKESKTVYRYHVVSLGSNDEVLVFSKHAYLDTAKEHCKLTQVVIDEFSGKIVHQPTATNSDLSFLSEKPAKSPEFSEEEIQERLQSALAVLPTLPTPSKEVEVIGSWVWVSFSGKPCDQTRAMLKEAGYRWARKKARWYYPTVPSNGRGKKSLPAIRQKYGARVLDEDKLQTFASF